MMVLTRICWAWIVGIVVFCLLAGLSFVRSCLANGFRKNLFEALMATVLFMLAGFVAAIWWEALSG